MTRVFLVGAKRTAFGAFGGRLTQYSATDLAVHATKAALASAGLSAAAVDTCVVGNVSQTSADAAYLARHVALKSGMEVPTPALTVNRLCGSGFQSVVNVAQEIKLGEAKIGVAAGTESMSQAPMSAYGQHVRFGTKLGSDLKMVDTLWAGLIDTHGQCPMGITAENLAEDHGITRIMSDAYAVQSQTRYLEALKAGLFEAEIAPMTLPSKKGLADFSVDEHPRLSTLEQMAKLKPTFKKEGVVTAAAASGICDGAGPDDAPDQPPPPPSAPPSHSTRRSTLQRQVR